MSSCRTESTDRSPGCGESDVPIDSAMEKSDHFDGTRFVNPTGTAGQALSAVTRMLLEALAPWPAHVDEAPRPPPGLGSAVALRPFVGHAAVLSPTAAWHNPHVP